MFLQTACHIKMRDRGSQRIGGVVGFWNLRKTKLNFYHFLNLFFVGRTIASERLFDLIGCVFRDWQPVLLRRQNRHAASLRYRNCRGDIFREE